MPLDGDLHILAVGSRYDVYAVANSQEGPGYRENPSYIAVCSKYLLSTRMNATHFAK